MTATPANLPGDRLRLPVYVIHHEAPEWCRETCLSLMASEGVDLSLTVVHNGGDLPRVDVRLITMGRNAGFSGAANAAIRDWLLGEEDLAVITSHDCYVEEGALAALAAVAQSERDAGIVGSPLRGTPLEVGPEPVEIDWVCGTLLLLRRQCMRDIGGFDERFGSYVEDVDLAYRARAAGWKVYAVPSARVSERGSSSAMAQPLADANRVLLRALHGPGRRRARLELAIGVCRSALRALVPGRRSARRYLRARLRALAASLRRPALLSQPADSVTKRHE